jgi:flagellar protein FlaG
MADQVNPMGNLAPGLPVVQVASVTPRPSSEKVRSAKAVEPRPQGQVDSPVAKASESTDTAMEQLNSHLQQVNSQLQFQVDKETGRTIYKVVSKDNGQVLLQVPSEEVLAMARNLRSMEQQQGVSGVLLDKKG